MSSIPAQSEMPKLPYESLDVLGLLRLLWQKRWTILLIATLFTAVGALYVVLADRWYQTSVMIVQSQRKGLSGNIAQLGSLASLAGINIGNTDGDSQASVAVLKSKELAREFIRDNSLTTVLLSDKWDAEKKRWKETDSEKQPDIRDAVEFFEKRVRVVTEDRKTGVLSLSISWKDGALAAQWANEMVKRANAKLRNRALAESERSIKYLQGEIAATNVPSLQQSLGRVMEAEMQKHLMARGDEEFAFKIVDSAFEPKKPVWPRLPIILGASSLLGMVMAIAFIVLRNRLI